jgi:hypothetical protein
MQARIWILTLKYEHADQISDKRDRFVYARGQREIGESTGYEHWQFCVWFAKPTRLAAIKKIWPTCHAEPTKSAAAESYCVKDETRVADTQFEIGTRPIGRSLSKDWNAIRSSACSGRMADIPPDVYVRCYNQLQRIAADHMEPVGIERKVFVFWGRTGTGKSRRAWEEAGLSAYPKSPLSKFWDGYRGHSNVVIDEFRGGIDIGNILRWFDRYPCIVEVKGSSVVLKATCIWITSNIPPEQWYPTIDAETLSALMRRLDVIHFE